VQALVLRTDTAVRMDDRAAAERLLGEARKIQLTRKDRATLGGDLRRAEEPAEPLAAERLGLDVPTTSTGSSVTPDHAT
jgi:hypothetical protein